jgi:very-short-patch-repair endonuclease
VSLEPYAAPDVQVAAALGVLAPTVAAELPVLGRRLRAGLWTRYGRVVVCHNGPLTPEQELWVAVLRSPRGVVLAGATAARRRGLTLPAPPRPELLVPADGPLPHLPGIDVARTRVLPAVDVHPLAQPPQLRLPRAVIDRASRVDRPDDVRALLCAAVQQRLLRADHLREVVERLGPVRHRALLLRTLDDVEGGAHSVRELGLLRVVRRGGLPMPDLQVVRQRPGGRYYLDAHWKKHALHAEVDGLGHLLVATWTADVDRANELSLSGDAECRLRIPGFWLDERPDHVVDQLRRGLLRGGWRPRRQAATDRSRTST